MNKRAFVLARKYITYRYTRALIRKSNSTDKQILSLLECNNEEAKQENSNKNPTVNSVQRDYMAVKSAKTLLSVLQEGYRSCCDKGYTFSRFRLFCTAYAQLLSCQFGGYAAKERY